MIAGAAGDMLLAALLDAGARRHVRAAGRLALDGLDFEVGRTERNGISAAHVEVIAPPERGSRSWSDVARADRACGSAGASARQSARGLSQAGGGGGSRPRDRAGERPFSRGRLRRRARGHLRSGVCARGPGRRPRALTPSVAARARRHGARPASAAPARDARDSGRGAALRRRRRRRARDSDRRRAAATLADEFGALPPMRLEAIGYGAGSREIVDAQRRSRPDRRADAGSPLQRRSR